MQINKLLCTVLLSLLIAAVAFSASTTKVYGPSNPWFDATGGPDAYGYTWIDSDEPGGPTYEWVDITTIGTQIDGMGDDMYAGPFSIGFDFTYYWYDVSQVYVGSNGYLKFPPPTNIASTFPATIPIADGENDFIAAYMMDLTFDTGGEAWYWTNNSDQFIVSFIQVPCWSTGGSHTFQIILDGTTNNITVNYGEENGTTNSDDILIGIENVNGQVGLLHSFDTYIPHANYTVVYDWPETSPYEAHDAAVQDVLTEGSKAEFVLQGENYSPTVFVKNVGNQPETNIRVRAAIRNAGGTIVWNDEFYTGDMAAGEILEVTFGSSWTASVTGQYSVEADVTLTGDLNPNNDTKTAELDIVVIPGELLYDDGVAETGMAWSGDEGGYAMYFDSPVVPAEITLLRYYISTSNPPQVFIAQILDDDGPGNAPGTILFEEQVACPTPNQWYNVSVPNLVIDDGKFYAAWHQTANSSVYMGIDQTAPISRNTWEWTGGWAPYRDAEIDDAMIRVMVGQGVIPEPLIAVSADTIDFGVVDTMQTVTEDFTIYSIGNVDLTINGITFTNNPGGLFFTLNGFTPGTVVPVGDSLELTIDFHPPIPSVLSSDMNIDSDSYINAIYTVFVTGEGQIPAHVKGRTEIPVEFELAQNMPNPFNPVTNIAYSLPTAAHVELVVYNVLGKEIARLVDTDMQAGYHMAVFDGANLGSGVYFYKITAGDFSEMKKMILMK